MEILSVNLCGMDFFFPLKQVVNENQRLLSSEVVGTSYPLGCSKGLPLLWTVAVALNSGNCRAVVGHTPWSDLSSHFVTVFFRINPGLKLHPWDLCPVLNR